jgi:hypothetical protein
VHAGWFGGGCHRTILRKRKGRETRGELLLNYRLW